MELTHKHHIIPRHAGGTDNPDNLIELTVSDHAAAHQLRYMWLKDPYDLIAYRCLTGLIPVEEIRRKVIRQKNFKYWTEEKREEQSKLMMTEHNPMRGRFGSANHMYGKKRTMTHDQSGSKNPMYGRKHSPETIEKMRQARRKWHNDRN